MKYINAEKLIAEIERLYDIARNASYNGEIEGEMTAYDKILSIITSLQQEQPMPDSTQLIEWWHEGKEMLKEKDFRDDPWRLAYNAFMCGFGRGIAVKKQEQQEVDLEKEVEFYCINKKVKMTIQELINYYIDTECAETAIECGF